MYVRLAPAFVGASDEQQIGDRRLQAPRSGAMCLGIPGKIIELREDTALATGVVDFGGAQREVCLAYVDGQVTIGDYVVVHVGFAISKIDEEEARKTYAVLEAMSELGDLELIRNGAESLVDLQNLPSAGPPPRGSLA